MDRAMDVSQRNQIPSTALVDYSEVKFEPELDSRFKCPVCLNPLKEPVQTGCGHRMCDECLHKILRNKNPQCPLDKEPLSPSEVFKDICFKREVLDLICYCLNRKYGCKWKKELLYLEEHLPVCEYREVPCENEGCKLMVPKKKLPQHMKETCRYKKMSCPHCGKHVPEIEMEAHISECEKVPVTCQYCGMTGILREQEKDHIENQCEAVEKPCKFKEAGCHFKGKLEDLTVHYDTQKDEHLKLTVQSMDSSKKEQEQLKEKMEKFKKDHEKLEKQLAEHRETLAVNAQNLRSYQARLSKAEKTIGDHKNAITQIRERAELPDHEEKLHFFESGLTRDIITGGGVRPFSNSRMQIQLAECKQRIKFLEERYTHIDTSYDGTYTWKIDEFSRRNLEGIIGITPYIYSPPFYVGRYGYKVCACMYPNGDGMGKDTHLSLFFVIMKGEYDALLPWPFRQKVTFMLLGQDRQQDVTDTLRPDPNSSSFKRPTSNMNIASGYPLFVSQKVLRSGSYIKDDTLFLEIIVEGDGDGLSREVLQVDLRKAEERIKEMESEKERLQKQIEEIREALAYTKQEAQTQQIKVGVIEKKMIKNPEIEIGKLRRRVNSEEEKITKLTEEIGNFKEELDKVKENREKKGSDIALGSQMEEILSVIESLEKRIIDLESNSGRKSES